MVKVSETEFDAGDDHGNSYVTKQTAFVEGSTTDRRDTSFLNDYRGRAVVVVSPQAPYILSKFDNLGRVVAVAQYSSSSGLDAGDDPVSLDTNRVAFSETAYDERGQVYLATRYKVNQSTGADSDSITSSTWFDPVGRAIKVQGESYSKTRYDRLGRAIRQYTLASDNDSGTYSNIYSGGQTDIAGDTVMEEMVTAYDNPTNTAIARATIMRHPSDSSTTGGLDTNADSNAVKFTAANIKGRIQISLSWYDALNRVIQTVNYGTNAIVGDGSTSTGTLDRTGLSVPSRSATTLRTDYTYDDAGRVSDVTDPRAKVARTTYDRMSRKIVSIANYVNGTPSGTTGDDDIHTRYVYTAGQQTKMWVDLDGDNVEDSDDQVTTWTYGVTKGVSAGDSKVSSNRLLWRVKYPPQYLTPSVQPDADRTVAFAYNAQGQEVYRLDQGGNVLERVYDTTGRLATHRFTTIQTGSGYDDTVKSIGYAYLSRGLPDTVTQYDHITPASGTPLDQVQYTYDDWGNLTKFEQDPDSKISGGTGRAAFDIQYTWAKNDPSTGRKTLRRATQTLPGSLALDYSYDAANSINDKLSRVEGLQIGGTNRTAYEYAGVGMLAATSLKEPSLDSVNYSGSSYPNLDQFNRVTTSEWRRDTGVNGFKAYYDVDVSYDENSNVTGTVDNTHRAAKFIGANRAFDVLYTLDGLNRVTLADEGTLSGGSISNRTRQETWTLTQTGHFSVNRLDLNGDLNFSDSGETDDARTHNNANEILTWDPVSTTYTIDHDNTGNMTDDGRDYKFTYDVLGRLRKVKNQSNTLVAEYTYNGLGYRIGWHYDADTDADVDSNDPWYWFAYDERWRMIASYRSTDSDPKERFLNHQAGLNGHGSSSYVDSVVFRDRDENTAWTSASDGTLEKRRYYSQNWRNDVVAIQTDTGKMVEWVKYFSYGTPLGLPAGDTDSTGATDVTDYNNVTGWGASAYDVRADFDMDGDVDATDATQISGAYKSLGKGVLTGSDVASRKTYAGHESDRMLGSSGSRFSHVRGGVMDAELGILIQRDTTTAPNDSFSSQHAKGTFGVGTAPTFITVRLAVAALCPPPPTDTCDCSNYDSCANSDITGNPADCYSGIVAIGGGSPPWEREAIKCRAQLRCWNCCSQIWNNRRACCNAVSECTGDADGLRPCLSAALSAFITCEHNCARRYPCKNFDPRSPDGQAPLEDFIR